MYDLHHACTINNHLHAFTICNGGVIIVEQGRVICGGRAGYMRWQSGLFAVAGIQLTGDIGHVTIVTGDTSVYMGEASRS